MKKTISRIIFNRQGWTLLHEGMAFPKLQEFMGEIQKFMDTDEKPFQMSSILPRGAKRELDSAVPMIAGFRPSKVYYMFTVLSFAELGSWDDVKMNGRAALEEYDEFLNELPDSKRNKPPTPLPPKDTIISQGFPQNNSARFHTSIEDLQFYSPRQNEENTPVSSRPSPARSRDAPGGMDTTRVPGGSYRSNHVVNGHRSNGRAPPGPEQRGSRDGSRWGSDAQVQNDDVLKNDIANSISNLRNELGSLKDRLSQELNNSPEVQNVSPPKPPLLDLKSPRSVRVDDVTDKLADAFSELFRKQWLGALKEKNNGTGHSEKNLIYLADITKKCQNYLEEVCEKEYNNLCEVILKPMGQIDSRYVHIPEDLRSLVRVRCRQVQRDTMPISLPIIKEVVIRDKIPEAMKSPALKKFVDRCVELMWMFAIHDPPLQLEWAREGELMSSNLESYTTRGNRVGFNVWPTLRQFRNGPVLSKGVVQPIY